jgi:putative heme-binding domain-containing protein
MVTRKEDAPPYRGTGTSGGPKPWPDANDEKSQIGRAGDANADVRLQAIRALTEFGTSKERRDLFVKALADKDAKVRHAALLGLFKFDGEPPDAVVTGPARDKDSYLRQAATLLLAEKASLDRLAKLTQDKDTATRLAGVLAVGFRLTLPPTHQPIPESLPLAPWRNADEAYVITFADGKEDLRKLGRVGTFNVAEHWKAGKHSAEQEKLFDLLLARLKDDDEKVRLQAVHFLSLLNDPRSEPEVVRVLKETDEKRLATAAVKPVPELWVAGPFPDGDEGFAAIHAPEQGVIDLSAPYTVGDGKLVWKEAKAPRLFDFGALVGAADASSYYAYCRLESGGREKAQLLVGSDDGIKVWLNGKLVWTNDVSRAALPYQDVVSVQLEPGSNDVLVRVRNHTGSSGVFIHYRARGQVAARLPEKLGLESLADRLKAGGKDIAPEFFTTDWTKAVKEGDAERGRKLFGALACAKCHGITLDAANTGGPSLAEAAKRFTVPYLVESVLLPGKQISPVFKATEVTTTKGQVLTGLAVADDAEKVELLLQDATRKVIPKKEIDSRRLLDSSPMPQGVVKTPAELRDLLAYLLSERPLPP